jgi:OmpA-OmpF porin, OOP family
MKRISIALLGAIGMAMALPAAAQREMLSSVYVGADVGQSKLKDCVAPGCDDKDTAWGLFAGYQFNRNIAAEVAYHKLGSFSTPAGDIDAKSWEVVAVPSWPLSNQFSVYGKLGAYRGKLEGGGASEKNTDLTYGLGLQFDLNRNVGLRGEWQRYPKLGGGGFPRDTDVDVLRVAALWRFQ